jgi:Uma2 family endonuclease
MLTLPTTLHLTPVQFAAVCAANPEAVLELDSDGTLIEMTPTGGETGARNTRLLFRFESWALRTGSWKVFDSSTGFLLPDGSVRSPDVSMVSMERWHSLSAAERAGFPPLCPDLVLELASPSAEVAELRRKMASYRSNGARVAWLLLPETRSVEVWQAGTSQPLALKEPPRLEAGPGFPGLALDLKEIWAA